MLSEKEKSSNINGFSISARQQTDNQLDNLPDNEKGFFIVTIVLLQRFDDYYHGYVDMEGKQKPGYEDMIQELTTKFPLSEPTIIGEQNQKDFIALFGAILRMRNLLSSFDEFAGKELMRSCPA